MVKAAWFLAGACALTALAGCIDPEQQLALDRQQCAGFGFTPGTDAFAGCMMRITQQRQAEAAAAERQRQQNQAIADQQAKQRQAEQDAANRAASEQSYQNWLKMSGHADPVVVPSSGGDTGYPPPTASRIPGMVCEGEGDEATCDAR